MEERHMATLTLAEATQIADSARTHATELGAAVTITVVDDAGNVRTQTRMDGARFGTLNVSANKAYTAAAFGAPTKVLTDLVQPGAPLFGFAHAMGGRFVSFAGGVPLLRDGEVIGAIGISGGSVDQDQAIADAGVTALAAN
jgi:uncharacterized protein GlcG (DUF336 family)